MSLKINTTDVKDVRIGAAPVDKIYSGTDLVWQRGIVYVSSAAAASASLTMPAHDTGDLLLMWAYRDGNATAPTLVSGWTSISSAGGNTNSACLAYKFATSSSEVSGTWENATGVVCLVYRGVTGIGTSAVGGSLSSGITHPALTMTHTDGTSWAVRFAGHRTATNITSIAPGAVPNTFRTGIATEVAAWDSNGGMSSNPTSTSQVVNGSSGYRVAIVELIGK